MNYGTERRHRTAARYGGTERQHRTAPANDGTEQRQELHTERRHGTTPRNNSMNYGRERRLGTAARNSSMNSTQNDRTERRQTNSKTTAHFLLLYPSSIIMTSYQGGTNMWQFPLHLSKCSFCKTPFVRPCQRGYHFMICGDIWTDAVITHVQ